MLRDLATIVLAMALALALGSYSAAWVTDRFDGFGPVMLGAWSAYPEAGTQNADPYARARLARTGQLPLGPAEGLRFVARTDSQGSAISGLCSYSIEGRVPSSRAWTLRIVDADGAPVTAAQPLADRINSRQVLRSPDRSFAVSISRDASVGNWLRLDHDGPVHFVLTLYDTTVAGAAALAETSMPAVRNTGCRR